LLADLRQSFQPLFEIAPHACEGSERATVTDPNQDAADV
jgi:hypothetical protein